MIQQFLNLNAQDTFFLLLPYICAVILAALIFAIIFAIISKGQIKRLNMAVEDRDARLSVADEEIKKFKYVAHTERNLSVSRMNELQNIQNKNAELIGTIKTNEILIHGLEHDNIRLGEEKNTLMDTNRKLGDTIQSLELKQKNNHTRNTESQNAKPNQQRYHHQHILILYLFFGVHLVKVHFLLTRYSYTESPIVIRKILSCA